MITLTEQQIENNMEWLKALRSGEYTQGKEQLYTPVSLDGSFEYHYCCLGVACVIQNLKKDFDKGMFIFNPGEEPADDDDEKYYPNGQWFQDIYGYDWNDIEVKIPKEQLSEFHECIANRLDENGCVSRTVSHANDSELLGFNFEKIANAIENWLTHNTNFK